MTLLFLLFAVGLVLLILGAEVLVRGATRLAEALGMSPLVIGLTVVAFGTSSPELAVSLKAQVDGSSNVAVGNVIGSNICNLLLILGSASLIAPVAISAQVIRRDVPTMIGVAFLPLLLGLYGNIGRTGAAFLFLLFLAHTVWLIRSGRQENALGESPESADNEQPAVGVSRHLVLNVVLVIAGLAMLFQGSKWVVGGALHFSRLLGISELVIGLTVVAVGTSLPEIATSVAAALRRQMDIAVGNVIGSNVFNILLVLGASGMVSPHGLQLEPNALRVDIPVMIAASVACLPIFFTGRLIDRWEGGLFVLYYAIYTAYLTRRAMNPDIALTYGMAVVAVILIPAVAISLISWFRTAQPRRNA